MGRVAHGFESLAGGHGAVTDNGHGTAVTACHFCPQCHAQGGTDGGGGVAHAKGVVLGFAALGKTGQAVLLTDAGDAFAAPGKDFVRIALVAHIPYQPVIRGVVQIVERHGQFHHAQAGTEVTATLAHSVKQVFTQFVDYLLQPGGR